MGSSMKVHQLARGLIWDHEPSLTLGCKRLRPLAPKLADTASSFDLKSFIRPESGPRKGGGNSPDQKKESAQVWKALSPVNLTIKPATVLAYVPAACPWLAWTQ